MTQPVNFELAKLLKQKGFNLECKDFYSKNGDFTYLKPHREYEHLHSYSEQLVLYFDGKYDWNSLDVDEGMIALKTAFSESDEWVNCECSAPTIAEVVMWLYEKHGIWVYTSQNSKGMFQWSLDYNATGDKGMLEFNTPTEAYEAGIKFTLENLI